jgi:hypothetical protein
LAFPSWSWVGWEGNVVVSFLKKSHRLLWDNEVSGPPIEIYPMIAWYKTHKQTGEKRLINNSYYSFQRMRNDASVPLPAGWSRAKPSNMQFNGQLNDLWIFKHKGIPRAEFIRPIPIPLTPLTPNRDIWDNHLTFRTSRCHLLSGPLLSAMSQRTAWSNISNDFVPYCLAFTLTDALGQWAGMMYSNFSNQNELVMGQKCEIIIISGGIAHIDENESVKWWLEEWKCIDDIKDKDTYEFYNVLWIERKRDIAFRKALGRVWKDAWQRQQVEEIDVILG